MEIPLIPTQVTTKHGDVVRVNDHVYISQWKETPTPWTIGRIMEFLPYSRVRLQMYLRVCDSKNTKGADPRALIASFYDEVCVVGQLRAKCYVAHKDSLNDADAWKKLPDRFIWSKFEAIYVKRDPWTVVPTANIKNLPDNILRTLKSRYEFVVTEKDHAKKLTCELSTCADCSQWVNPSEAVHCANCGDYFHLRCVKPPLPAKAKLSRGYVWNCGPCSHSIEEAAERRALKVAKSEPAPPARKRGRPPKDHAAAQEREGNPPPVKYFNLWPYRYVGQLSNLEDTLDPNDYIFCRQAGVRTSLKGKYQADIPLMGSELPEGTEPRGEGDSVELLSCVHRMTDEEVAEFEMCKRRLTSSTMLRANVDWLTEATFRLCEKYAQGQSMKDASMQDPFRLRRWKKDATKFIDRPWAQDEKNKFAEAIKKHGADLQRVQDHVGTRDIYEVVRFYGHWKNEKLGEMHAQSRDKDAHEDAESVYQAKANKEPVCTICKTRESKIWLRGPGKFFGKGPMCEPCGILWRKYADVNMLLQQQQEKKEQREESASAKAPRGEKREREPTPAAPASKKPRTSAAGSRTTATPPPVTTTSIAQVRCSACHKNGPAGKVLKCKRCGTKMHAGVCGVIPEPGVADTWKCDLCLNEEQAEPCLNTDCVLCPSPKHIREREKERDKRTGKEKERDPNDTFLRACKQTEGQCWAHVLCAVFMPGVTFTDASRLRLVEGISSVDRERFQERCVLCKQLGGALVQCVDCNDAYHASCAWNKNYRFGFEMHPTKHSQRGTPMVSFREKSGTMKAVVRCRRHEGPYVRPPFFDMCDTNEFGETALQVFCRHYKQAPVAQSHGLLRKATRLDAILPAAAERRERAAREGPCASCATKFTPRWHESARGCFCHSCWVLRESHRGTNGAGHAEGLSNGSRARAAVVNG